MPPDAKSNVEKSTQLRKNLGRPGGLEGGRAAQGARRRARGAGRAAQGARRRARGAGRAAQGARRRARGEAWWRGGQVAAAVLARTISSAGIVSWILDLRPASISLRSRWRLRLPISM